ncbi:hypothetical protein [Aquimarina sp. AU474]|uniref:hypothetical protein n=1 Tax=Aquimarina sp. AU474 TaxID=2108529 RepID=UPI000D690B36|nr:hypothetical protein [Aquimarina sp. AU474]
MQKKQLKTLNFKREVISKLGQNQIKAGYLAFQKTTTDQDTEKYCTQGCSVGGTCGGGSAVNC